MVAHAELLEPFFAGIVETFSNQQNGHRYGLDILCPNERLRHEVDFLDYKTTVGHLSLYYDAGGLF